MATEDSTELTSTSEDVSGATRCSAYDEEIFVTVGIVSLVSDIISLLAVSLVPFFIILFKRWSFFNQRLTLYLSIATIVAIIAFMLSRFDQERFCIFSGFITQIGAWMSLNAYICITATLLLKVFFTTNLEKLDIPIILIIFLSPFLFNWMPFIQTSYGKAGPLCWIKNSLEINGTCEHHVFGQAMQLVLWYIPLYLVLSIMIILYVIILVKFYFHRKQWARFDQDTDNERRQAMNYTLSLLAYPLVYFLVNIFPFINRIYGLTNPSNPSPALWLLLTTIYPQQGTGIAIVFLVSIRKRLTAPSLKAAIEEWCHKTQIKEYHFDEEDKGSGSYKDFDKQ